MNREIGLFFEKKHVFDPIIMAQKLNEKIPELGRVNILPIDEKQNGLVLVYEASNDIKLYISLTNILLHINENLYTKLNEYLKIIFSILKSFDISIIRCGLINTIILGTKERNLFANNAFDSKEIIEANDFQLSYHQIINYNNIKLNCWKRYITNHNDFIVTFDINTIQSEQIDITYKFIIDYIKYAVDYMNNNHIVPLY